MFTRINTEGLGSPKKGRGAWTVCRFKGGEANVGKKEWSGGFEGKVHAHYAL